MLLSACSSPEASKALDCNLHCETGCAADAGACHPLAADAVPVPEIRFNPSLPSGLNDYPDTPDSSSGFSLPPDSTVYLSAADSYDPEGQPISTFWNVQDQAGNYLTVDPDPSATRVSFTPGAVGSYAVTLAAVEVSGLKQLAQTQFMLTFTPLPCAPDGFSPPCSDELAVPGGTFMAGSAEGIGFSNEHPSHVANVAAFMMDKYEVTVGRYRRFLTAFSADGFADGVGAHPLIPGSGWQSAWNGETSQEINMSISECGGPWTEEVGRSEARPVTCVTWYQAFAFCIWDGKRLPTETEWEFAAVGGSEQRTYPWGSAAPSPNLAVYGCLFDGEQGCTDADLPVVGSLGAGAGRFGQLDLAGSVWEWTLDVYAPYTAEICDNCANLEVTADDGRVFRGGDYVYDDQGSESDLRGASRLGFDAKFPDPTRGFRCARTP